MSTPTSHPAVDAVFAALAADASTMRAASTERDLLDLRTRVSAVEIELAKLKR